MIISLNQEQLDILREHIERPDPDPEFLCKHAHMIYSLSLVLDDEKRKADGN
jgi:hypothetical protein